MAYDKPGSNFKKKKGREQFIIWGMLVIKCSIILILFTVQKTKSQILPNHPETYCVSLSMSRSVKKNVPSFPLTYLITQNGLIYFSFFCTGVVNFLLETAQMLIIFNFIENI